MPVEVDLSRIIINELSDSQVIDLRERYGNRRLPITIGVFEATSIDRYAKGLSIGRPLSHQLIVAIAERLGGQLQDVLITEWHENTFYAVLRVRCGHTLAEIDCRPSDAIAVAMACDPTLPIFAQEEVFAATA